MHLHKDKNYSITNLNELFHDTQNPTYSFLFYKATLSFIMLSSLALLCPKKLICKLNQVKSRDYIKEVTYMSTTKEGRK